MCSLDRRTLSQFLPNPESVLAFEKMFKAFGDTLPSSIEEANAVAAQAQATAAAAFGMLVDVLSALERLASAPVPVPAVDADDYAPRPHLGTLSTQNQDAVEISGGTIDGVTVGATTPKPGAFTTLTATSTVGIGTNSPSGNFRMETPSNSANAVRLGQVAMGLSGGGYPQVGYNFRTTSTTDAYNYDVADVSSVVRFNAGTVDFMRAASGSAGTAITYSSMGRFSSTGLTVANGFGCNGKGPQGPAVSGGTLSGVITALVANGILSS